MTIMTEYQRELVEQNLELVTQVIRKRIKVNGTVLQSYDDFYSVGCEALCHAAMRYRTEMGEFAPFACVLIYHAMIDHCRKQNRLMAQSSDFQTETDNESISLRHLSADYDYDTTMLGVLKRIGITKKMSYEVADLFAGQSGVSSGCNAYQLYLAMSDVIFLAQCEGASAYRIAQLEENIARALRINWHEYDRPGNFKW